MTRPADRQRTGPRSGGHVPGPNRFPGTNRSPRSGAVALALTLILVLLIGTAAVTVGRRDTAIRIAEHERRVIQCLENAVEAARQTSLDSGQTLRLPVATSQRSLANDSPGPIPSHHIMVTLSTDSESGNPQWVATLFRDDRPLQFIARAQ